MDSMKRAGIAVAAIGVVFLRAPQPVGAQGAGSPLSEAQVKAKVEALLGQMTLEEKIGQLTQIAGGAFPPGAKAEETVRAGGAGSVLWVDNKRFNELQKMAVEESRLKVPLLFGLDVIHGYQTIFPAPLGMAASWDPSVEERAQSVAAKEARAAGVHWTFAPMVDVARDARWGRIMEGAGEDPYLGSAMAAAQVRGFQGPYIGAPDRVVACVKHFAAYGAAEGGRDYDSVYVPEGLLRNVYLPPFHAAVKAGVGSLMSAYMDLNDVPAVANRFLLRDVLRKEWGFGGFVVSDAFAVGNLLIQGFARDGRDAAERAFLAGVNMDMASRTFPQHLPGLVKDGKISVAQIDEAVRPLLAVKLRLGLFEHPYSDEARAKAVLGAPEHLQEARLAAQRSLVLLRNEGGLLPLKKALSSVAVIGPLADSPTATEGGWMVFGHVTAAVTVREGIRSKLGDAVRVEYAKGPDIKRDVPSFFDDIMPGPPQSTQTPAEADVAFGEAVKTAQKADAVVMVLGEESNMSGESASRSTLELPGRQEELLKAVVATGKPVVLVLMAGRPLSINWAAAHVPAILEAWQPGSQGGHAVADALFGDVNPGGKLPVTFPRSAGYSPYYYAHNLTFQPEGSPNFRSRYWEGPTTPIYPFGYGLSYTTFSFANLKTDLPQVKAGGQVTVSVDVTNKGSVAGDEVAQFYLHQKAGSDSRPVRELKGFERITLKPGETKTVRFHLGPDELGYWSTSHGKWIQEEAAFDLWAGGDSTAPLHADLTVTP